MKEFNYKTVVISDTHLGKDASSAKLLYEFLSHVSCETLILNGDIIDGWSLSKSKRHPFKEMHARCLDAINALSARGVKIIWVRGNHDEDLKKVRIRGQKLYNQTVEFKDKNNTLFCPITFVQSYKFIDLMGRKCLAVHGDIFDEYQKNTTKKKLAKFLDKAYEQAIQHNNAIKDWSDNQLNPAQYIKKKVKDLWVVREFKKRAFDEKIIQKFDILICGHIHHGEKHNVDHSVICPLTKQDKEFTYINSGDWQEGSTAAAEKHNGEWVILHWDQIRRDIGLKDLPHAKDNNIFAEFRVVTERQLSLIRRLWPGKNYSDILQDIVHARQKYFNALSGKQPHKAQKWDRKLEDLRNLLRPYPI